MRLERDLEGRADWLVRVSMRTLRVTAAVTILTAVVASSAEAQVQPPAGQAEPSPGQPAPEQPSAPPAQTDTTAPPAPAAARTFTAPVGLLFNTVRPERQADFEKVIAYLRAAMEKSSDSTVRAQAKGWRIFKASEPGPNGTVLYVFLLDPTVAGADYGLGRILAEGYPDATQLQEIWRLYQGAVTSGGSLLNLTPIAPEAPPPLTAPATGTPAPAGAAPPPPPENPGP